MYTNIRLRIYVYTVRAVVHISGACYVGRFGCMSCAWWLMRWRSPISVTLPLKNNMVWWWKASCNENREHSSCRVCAHFPWDYLHCACKRKGLRIYEMHYQVFFHWNAVKSCFVVVILPVTFLVESCVLEWMQSWGQLGVEKPRMQMKEMSPPVALCQADGYIGSACWCWSVGWSRADQWETPTQKLQMHVRLCCAGTVLYWIACSWGHTGIPLQYCSGLNSVCGSVL